MRSKRTKACEFTAREREEIYERDNNQCIFCAAKYKMSPEAGSGRQIMHYIPRSRGGLGISANAAVGCIYHHQMLDNGSRGEREEMLGIFREYLRSHEWDWNEEKLVYSKW